MISPEFSTTFTLAIYATAALAGILGLLFRRRALRNAGAWLAFAAFASQTLFLFFGFHKTFSGALSLGAYLQLLAWFVLLCGLLSWWRFRQAQLLLFASPLGLILFLMSAPWLHLMLKLPGNLETSFFALHVGSLFLALGLLALASCCGLFFLILQKHIKSKKLAGGFLQDLPALGVLDKINAICVFLAFPFYTFGLVTGLVWAKQAFGETFSGDPKELFSIFIWFLLAMLFHNRLAKGWNGRKPALLAIFIFLLSLLSIIGINFFMHTHHAFLHN